MDARLRANNGDVAGAIKKLSIGDKRPKIHVSTKEVIDKVLWQSYDGDVFVSASMAEGFNIPVLEAMRMGLPAIVTDHGGHLDFANEETGWLIPSKEFEVTHDVAYEGINWHKPDVKALQQLMRYAFEHREEVKEKGLTAFRESSAYSWRKSAKKLLYILDEENF